MALVTERKPFQRREIRKADQLVVTPHARKRWAERVPAGVDLLNEYLSARLVGKKRKKKIAAACPVSAEKYMQNGFAGRYFMESRRSNIIFVMQAPETVITVFCLD